MNQPCSKRPLSALIFSCESCIKTHFFSLTSEAHFVSRSSTIKLCATVNVILAAAVTFLCAFLLFNVLYILSVFCLSGPEFGRNAAIPPFFTSLFVLRQPRPTSPHFLSKDLLMPSSLSLSCTGSMCR